MTESTCAAPRSRLSALIAEARRRGHRRNIALAGIGLLLLAGGGIWAGLSLGGGGTGAVHAPPGYHVVRAQGPVAHRVLETWAYPQAVSLDVATGRERPLRTTSEIWYDTRGRASRTVLRADGRIQADHAGTCPRRADPRECSPGFAFQSYWPLDPSKYTRQPGIGAFHGRPVIWIAPRQPGGFVAYPREGERVGLDPRTHQPVADRSYVNGKVVSEAEVLARKPDIAARDFAFVVPNPYDPLHEGTARSASGSDPLAVRARRTLGRDPLWLGDRFGGNLLRKVTIGWTYGPPTGNRPDAVPFVQYDYGRVTLAEFASLDLFEPAGGPVPGRATLVKSAATPLPAIVGMQLTKDGVFVMANRSAPGLALDRSVGLRLARALRPVPLP